MTQPAHQPDAALQAALLQTLGAETAREMLETMWTIRIFEEKAKELYALGRIHGTMHLSIGQEATAVGASCAACGYDYLLTIAPRPLLSWSGDVDRRWPSSWAGAASAAGAARAHCRRRA